jgi:hypothetical protein
MNRDLLAGTVDPRIHTFVVHEPVLGLARLAPWLRPAGGKGCRECGTAPQQPQRSALLEPLRSVRATAFSRRWAQEQ